MTETYEEKFKRMVKEKTKPDDIVIRGTLAPKELKNTNMKELYNDVMKWGEQSQQGLLCGIFGCNAEELTACPICGCGYCADHIPMHFHAVDNDGIFRDDKEN